MLNPRVAARYAKSLMDVAQEQNQLDAVQADMKYIQAICKQSPEFVSLLRSPIISADRKLKIIEEITGKNVNQITNLFLKLLVNKGREANMPEIATAYQTRYNQAKGIHRVKITTAQPIGDELVNKMIAKLKSVKQVQTVEVETAIDPKLIGGYKMQMDDFLIDNSISRDLNDVKKQFLNNDYLHNIR